MYSLYIVRFQLARGQLQWLLYIYSREIVASRRISGCKGGSSRPRSPLAAICSVSIAIFFCNFKVQYRTSFSGAILGWAATTCSYMSVGHYYQIFTQLRRSTLELASGYAFHYYYSGADNAKIASKFVDLGLLRSQGFNWFKVNLFILSIDHINWFALCSPQQTFGVSHLGMAS